MPKTLKIAFTGSCVLTPAYPDDLAPVSGPLVAIMPGARRVRRSTFTNAQINAQFAFVMFPYRHLYLEPEQLQRDADYKYPDVKRVATGLCFLESEELRLETKSIEQELSFDRTPISESPTRDSRGALWIARWEDFAAGGSPAINPEFLTNSKDCTRVVLQGGKISGEFVGEPIARINFDYGPAPQTRPYAQEIVVTLTFDDEVEEVTFSSFPFRSRSNDPSRLTFRWYDQSEIRILFGNGSLASIQSALQGSFVGQDHDGDYDMEFEVLYSIGREPGLVVCGDDGPPTHRLPLPQVKSTEILRVPCIATMVTGPTGQTAMKSGPVPPAGPEKAPAGRPAPARSPESRREPGESRNPARRKL